jgi:uncharacterized protein YbjT (DUF2867 family)
MLILKKYTYSMPDKTATLIGATGLIGSHLLNLLREDPAFSLVKVLVRRPVDFKHSKIKVLVIDFSDANAYKQAITGSDAVFVAVGTTQKKVKGDLVAYRKVDFNIPVNAALACKETGCPKLLLVSSVGANSKGGNFYIKLKGEVEDKIQGIGLPSVSIFRPSMLLGKRNESRPAESIAQSLSKGLSFLFPSKYKPIKAYDVARAMIAASKNDLMGCKVYQHQDMMELIGA